MANKDLISKCTNASKRIRRQIIEMTYATGNTGAHLGGSLSIVELLAGLYAGIIKFKPDEPNWEGRDRVILSKGHAAMALYPAMVEANIISESELSTFKQDGSKLGGHPSLNGLPGIEFASGSLGQGLSLGTGTCLALKRKDNNDSRSFVFLGDGECDEGSVWEAAASAAHYKLDNLVAIVDMNAIQYDGYTTEVLDMSPFEKKWKDFGWDVLSIDGHNIEEILDAYTHRTDKPLAILAHTIKGKGISFMENNWKYHNSNLSKELYEKAVSELEAAV
ncbi:transketolase [Treponema sp. Marseille-Q3903]|uniref:transketolase n=1 Tax=Treponema sp. Marseille-Q3903 TaxID=2766703 RepID=UPI0016526838|nr:transketolase [Treponema sp. Marseille-Q3903]MBC6714289.1 transketolase [Treponema sp. Marseille-Q3903]